MNPYLEACWGDVHTRLVPDASDQLQPVLPDDLRAGTQERVFIESVEPVGRSFYPDVHVYERRGAGAPWATPGAGARAGDGPVAIAEPLVIHVPGTAITECYVEIVDARSGGRVVTVIEFVSRSNKTPGPGRDLYRARQEDRSRARANLVEIDLLRAGQPVTLVPRTSSPRQSHAVPRLRPARSAADALEYYPVPLPERLPTIKVPLKPTRARNPSGPDVGEGWGGQTVSHVITRTVRDSAAFLDATAGPDVGDPYWAPPPSRPFLDEVGADPGRLRIAVCTQPWNGHSVHAECGDAVLATAKLCEQLGHTVGEARPEIDFTALRQAQYTVVCTNIRATIEGRAAALGREVQPDDVEKLTWRTASWARERSAADYARSIHALHRAGRAVGRFFTSWDVLLTPTMCRPPLRLGELDTMSDDADRYVKVLMGTIAFTSLFNSAGTPAMSVPLAWTGDGLPIGVQFVAGFGEEARLLRLAAQLEAARPWKDRRPSL